MADYDYPGKYCDMLRAMEKSEYVIDIEQPDLINSPPHYQHGGIETIDLIEAFLTPEEFRGYLKGTLYAYRDRAPYKGQTESDYEKARRYWDWLQAKLGEMK